MKLYALRIYGLSNIHVIDTLFPYADDKFYVILWTFNWMKYHCTIVRYFIEQTYFGDPKRILTSWDPQLIVSFSELEKSSKTLKDKIQSKIHCRIQKPKKKNVLMSPFWGPIPNRPKSSLNRAEFHFLTFWILQGILDYILSFNDFELFFYIGNPCHDLWFKDHLAV